MTSRLSVDDLVEIDELLAAIEEKYDSMDASEADGFMTALCLLPQEVPTREWVSKILSTKGLKGTTGNSNKDKRLVGLLRARYQDIGDALKNSELIDPLVFEDDDQPDEKSAIRALEPFALGFLEALQEFPGLLESEDERVCGALPGILRHLPEEALGDFKKAKEELDVSTPLENLDDALFDLATCIAQIGQATKGWALPETAEIESEES